MESVAVIATPGSAPVASTRDGAATRADGTRVDGLFEGGLALLLGILLPGIPGTTSATASDVAPSPPEENSGDSAIGVTPPASAVLATSATPTASRFPEKPSSAVSATEATSIGTSPPAIASAPRPAAIETSPVAVANATSPALPSHAPTATAPVPSPSSAGVIDVVALGLTPIATDERSLSSPAPRRSSETPSLAATATTADLVDGATPAKPSDAIAVPTDADLDRRPQPNAETLVPVDAPQPIAAQETAPVETRREPVPPSAGFADPFLHAILALRGLALPHAMASGDARRTVNAEPSTTLAHVASTAAVPASHRSKVAAPSDENGSSARAFRSAPATPSAAIDDVARPVTRRAHIAPTTASTRDADVAATWPAAPVPDVDDGGTRTRPLQVTVGGRVEITPVSTDPASSRASVEDETDARRSDDPETPNASSGNPTAIDVEGTSSSLPATATTDATSPRPVASRPIKPAPAPENRAPALVATPPDVLARGVVASSPRAAATAPAPAAPAILPAEVLEQIRFRVVAGEDGSQIRLVLDPPELGRVRLHVTSSDDGRSFTASVQVDRPEIAQALSARLPELSRSLADAGLKVDHVSIASSPAGDGGREPFGPPFGSNDRRDAAQAHRSHRSASAGVPSVAGSMSARAGTAAGRVVHDWLI